MEKTDRENDDRETPDFTPGPWTADGYYVRCTNEPTRWIVEAGSYGELREGHAFANAHLIAAAPDMFAAVQAILEAGDDEGGADDGGQHADALFWKAVGLARTAMAKAQGKKQEGKS